MHFIEQLVGTKEDNHGGKAGNWVSENRSKITLKKLLASSCMNSTNKPHKQQQRKPHLTKTHDLLPCQWKTQNPHAQTNLID